MASSMQELNLFDNSLMSRLSPSEAKRGGVFLMGVFRRGQPGSRRIDASPTSEQMFRHHCVSLYQAFLCSYTIPRPLVLPRADDSKRLHVARLYFIWKNCEILDEFHNLY